MNRQRRRTGASSMPSNAVPFPWESNQSSHSEELYDSSQERLPSQLTADCYKENLAATFDSKSSITPLWEDRYCDPATQAAFPQRSNPQLLAERWKDKKAMRQFHIRMQKVGIESENSSEGLDPSRHDDEVIAGQSAGGKGSSRRQYRRRDSTSDSEVNLLSTLFIEFKVVWKATVYHHCQNSTILLLLFHSCHSL